MAKEIAPGLMKSGRKFAFAGYKKVRVVRKTKNPRAVHCDGCHCDIAPLAKFISAHRGRSLLAFHNMDCMKKHYHSPEIQRQVEMENKRILAADEAAAEAGKIRFGSKDAERLDVDRSKGPQYPRQRAMMIGDPIDRERIFERDGYRCHICNLPVDRTKEWPYPTSATTDHVIAIANGGTHTWGNVSTSHWMCNREKRTKEYMTPGELVGQITRVERILRKDGVLPKLSDLKSA